jgi:HEAT repeat protein
LLDGLDECHPSELPAFSAWLTSLLDEFSEVRLVAAGPIQGYDGLADAGLVPVRIAPWSASEVKKYLDLWSQSWQQFIVPSLPKKRITDIDPALISGWLRGSMRGETPLEITMRVWAAFSGDVRGKLISESYEAYLGRMLSQNERQSAEAAAVAWIRESEGAIRERSLRRGTPVNDLIAAGILTRRISNRVSFRQPSVGAYLAACGMAQAELLEAAHQRLWAPAQAVLIFYASMVDVSQLVDQLLDDSTDPIESGLLYAAGWLREAPPEAPWRAKILRALATIASDKNRPYGLRLRTIHALASTGEKSTAILFRRLLASEIPSSRVLGALGLGGFPDEDSVEKLIDTVYADHNLQVRQAACLGLAGIGNESALEGLGKILLDGDESVRLAAAEALASHPDEGYDMLRDAMEVENLLTRRAAVFGLGRVPEAWAAELLGQVQVEDDQWVVRGAAAEVIERQDNPPWKIEPPILEVADLPWLIEFASREGLGIAPGPAAFEMVRRALNKGTEEEKVAALETIAWLGAKELGIELRQALGSDEPFLRDAAYEALWRMRAAGVELAQAPQETGEQASEPS